MKNLLEFLKSNVWWTRAVEGASC